MPNNVNQTICFTFRTLKMGGFRYNYVNLPLGEILMLTVDFILVLILIPPSPHQTSPTVKMHRQYGLPLVWCFIIIIDIITWFPALSSSCDFSSSSSNNRDPETNSFATIIGAASEFVIGVAVTAIAIKDMTKGTKYKEQSPTAVNLIVNTATACLVCIVWTRKIWLPLTVFPIFWSNVDGF